MTVINNINQWIEDEQDTINHYIELEGAHGDIVGAIENAMAHQATLEDVEFTFEAVDVLDFI